MNKTQAAEQRIVPNIWCSGNAEEVSQFIAGAFSVGHIPAVTNVVGRYPTEGLPDFQREFAGKPLVVDVEIDGYTLSLINAGNEFKPSMATSFMLNFDPLFFDNDPGAAEEALHRVWSQLMDGATIRMPLQEYPFSARYGWLEDRFGINWQLMLTDAAGDPRPFVLPSLLFSGPVQGKAEEAGSFYRDVFEDSAAGQQARYPEQTGPAAAGELMFSDFKLLGQWFTAMDSGAEVSETFTPGVSFEVKCADQADIDHYWNALSASPEHEQCGWLQDQYGLSWQIVPANLGELMAKPDAYQKLMGMKKIVIDEF